MAGKNGLERSMWSGPSDQHRRRTSRSLPPQERVQLPAQTPTPSQSKSHLPSPPSSSRLLPAKTTSKPSSPGPSAIASLPLRAAPTGLLDPLLALHRFEKLCRRLHWKTIDLLASLERAKNPESCGFTAEDAQMNFKVDFHELYLWIEQAIVFLQLVFGISIPRPSRGNTTHAYHHNVLQALDDASNPLYQILGRGEAKEALWKAKELRNRWKDAGVEGDGPGEGPSLGMYDIRWILGTVMGGLEEAYPVAKDRVRALKGTNDVAETGQEGEEGWDWMMEDGDTVMMDA